MPGIKGPSDYSQEPPRHPALKINAKEPFNAEPPRSALISSYVTPVDFFYKRNHGPIPIVEDIERYFVSVTGLIDNPKQIFMKDIWNLPKHNVAATLQCAGNRRTAMSKTKPVRGVGWDVSAIGNDENQGLNVNISVTSLLKNAHNTYLPKAGLEPRHRPYSSSSQMAHLQKGE